MVKHRPLGAYFFPHARNGARKVGALLLAVQNALAAPRREEAQHARELRQRDLADLGVAAEAPEEAAQVANAKEEGEPVGLRNAREDGERLPRVIDVVARGLEERAAQRVGVGEVERRAFRVAEQHAKGLGAHRLVSVVEQVEHVLRAQGVARDAQHVLP